MSMCASRGTVLGRRPPVGVPSRHPGSNEEGLTVLELMVVFGIITVLIFIALPGFVTARRSAQRRAAQAELRAALQAANTVYADVADLTQIGPGNLSAVEPSLQFIAGPVTVRRQISVSNGTLVGGQNFLGLAEPAGDGTCWYTLETDTSPPTYGGGAAAADGSCNANDATGATSQTFPALSA